MPDDSRDISVDSLYHSISAVLVEARSRAYRTINSVMVEAYWQIGRLIVEEEQKGQRRAEYGKAIIKELSKRLTSEFGKGYSVQNLRYIRQFYLVFPKHHSLRGKSDLEKHHSLRGELCWTHYRHLLRVEDPKAREWYMNEAANCNWSTRALDRQINSLYYLGCVNKTGLILGVIIFREMRVTAPKLIYSVYSVISVVNVYN